MSAKNYPGIEKIKILTFLHLHVYSILQVQQIGSRSIINNAISEICDPRIIWKPFGIKLMIDCKKEVNFSWFFIRYIFQLKKRHF